MPVSKLFSNIALIILGISIGIGIDRYWLRQSELVNVDPGGETAIEHARRHTDPGYVCPMHSDVRSKELGNCPICGMQLVERGSATPAGTDNGSIPEVLVSPEFMHNFGVRTATVERGSVSRLIVALGRVARMPQPRVTDVAAGLKGKIVSVSGKAIGDHVSEGERLYSLDSAEWRELQQSYLDALAEDDRIRASGLRKRLQSLGMNANALERLIRGGDVEPVLDRRAPVSGTIVDWYKDRGDSVDASAKVVNLGGVNRIPIIISLFEGQGAWVHRGQRITVRAPSIPGAEFEGQVDRRDREINFSTRTLPVYAGFNTSDPGIRYGMLVEVTIKAQPREKVLRIPREALIRTGKGSRVIVARGAGRFQPVSVIPGIESGDHIEIVSGLEEGQEVVVSGQFLIDSESSLSAGLQRMATGDAR